jgi:hypothetical protein
VKVHPGGLVAWDDVRQEIEDQVRIKTAELLRRAEIAEEDLNNLTESMRLQIEACRDHLHMTEGPLSAPNGYFVYFLYGTDDELLYVGQSANILARLGQHVKKLGRRISRIETTQYSTAWQMMRAERDAITSMNPVLNIRGKPDWTPPRRSALPARPGSERPDGLDV